MTFQLTSPAFANGEPIPEQHARGGGNLPPLLVWSGAPRETRSFALIVEDPDAPAGTFRHWGVYNLPAELTSLPDEGGHAETINDFGERGYGGPQPPRGHGVHHYRFRLLALDAPSLDLPPDATVADLLDAAQPHIVGEADLIGTFERS
jgi:Raf kinase inhibitor-like YbhB/YbcL family protein